jgi:Ca-activated chloride channel family protein
MTDVTFSMSAALDRRLFCRDGGSARHIVVRMRADGLAAQIAEERKPLNIALVIDASASMRGEKLDAAKAASLGLIDRLVPSDRLSLVSFAEDARTHLDAVPASAEHLARMRAEVNWLEARGNTDLALGYFSGVERVAQVAERDAAMTPRVVLLSDGRANRGIVHHAELLSYDIPGLPCDKGAAARHTKYAGQRRGTDREWVGHRGPCGSVIAPVFSHDLNG